MRQVIRFLHILQEDRRCFGASTQTGSRLMRLDIGIKTRIYGGFGVLVALGLALALFASWQLNWVDTAVGKMSQISNGRTHILEISREFGIMRRVALSYKLDNNADSLKEGTAAAA